MEWWQILLGMLGSSVLTVFAKGWIDSRAEKRARKNELEDRKMEKDEKKQTLEEQFVQFRTEQKRENAELRQRMGGLESAVHAISKNTRSLVYNDIRRDALASIKQGRIDPEERVKLKDRYVDYVSDYGDDSLKNIMAELDNL